MVSQAKFAEKREATLLETDVLEVRTQRDKAAGEVSALKYINTSLKAQVDEFLKTRSIDPAQAPPPGPAKQRRTAKKSVK